MGSRTPAKNGTSLWSTWKTWRKSTAIAAALIGAAAAILAAIIGGLFLLIEPIWSGIVDQYFNYTADIEISDVASVRSVDRLALDIVLGNPSKVNQAVVSLELTLHQTGSPLAMIAKTDYTLDGELQLTSTEGGSNGKVVGTVQPDPAAPRYRFTGRWEDTVRGEWTLVLTIPVREELVPGQHRSIVIVLPTTMEISDTKDSFFGGSPRQKYVSRNPPEFKFAEFLRDAGESDLRILVRRGDGKMVGSVGTAIFSR